MPNKRSPDWASILIALPLLPSTLFAGGIYVPMKGATATGFANVGLTSLARDGSTLFYNPAGMTQLERPFAELGVDWVNADIGIALPDRLALSLTQAIAPQLTLLAEIQWFGWDVFEDIRVPFDDRRPDMVRPQGFENTYTAGLAAQYALDAHWTLRGGIQYDQSPTIDALRNISIPDSDLTWIGAGLSYAATERLRLDIGYVYGRFARQDIDLTLPIYAGTPLASSVNVRGETGSHVETLSLSVAYRYGD